jgi:hypothetical protein
MIQLGKIHNFSSNNFKGNTINKNETTIRLEMLRITFSGRLEHF